jgi:hypothetical protein
MSVLYGGRELSQVTIVISLVTTSSSPELTKSPFFVILAVNPTGVGNQSNLGYFQIEKGKRWAKIQQ